jgi:hypothetical protein
MIGGGCVGNISSLGDGRNNAQGNRDLPIKKFIFPIEKTKILQYYTLREYIFV